MSILEGAKPAKHDAAITFSAHGGTGRWAVSAALLLALGGCGGTATGGENSADDPSSSDNSTSDEHLEQTYEDYLADQEDLADGGAGGSAATAEASCLDAALIKDDDGGTFTVDEGCVLSIELGSNPSTGYEWQLSAGDLTVQADGYSQAPSNGMVGVGGTSWWRVVADVSGTHTISGAHVRPWEVEEGTEPEPSWQITIIVQ